MTTRKIDDLDSAQADVVAARAKVADLRRAVVERRAGVAELHSAHWELHEALCRVETLRKESEAQPAATSGEVT